MLRQFKRRQGAPNSITNICAPNQSCSICSHGMPTGMALGCHCLGVAELPRADFPLAELSAAPILSFCKYASHPSAHLPQPSITLLSTSVALSPSTKKAWMSTKNPFVFTTLCQASLGGCWFGFFFSLSLLTSPQQKSAVSWRISSCLLSVSSLCLVLLQHSLPGALLT